MEAKPSQDRAYGCDAEWGSISWTGAPNVDALAAPEEGLETVRITVTNPQAQTTLEQTAELRGSIVMLIRRAGRGFLPTGKTLIELGDQLTVFGPAAAVSRARRHLTLEGRRDDQ